MEIKTNASHKRVVGGAKILSGKVKHALRTSGMSVIILGMITLFSGCELIKDNPYNPDNVPFSDHIDSTRIKHQLILEEHPYHFFYPQMPITNDFIENLPEGIMHLTIPKSLFVTDLSQLPEVAPGITYLDIRVSPKINNYDFVYDLPNLKWFYATNNTGITQELLDYLIENEIETDLTQKDVENNIRIQEIVNEITTPEMSDQEKLQAITLYVIRNVRYDESLAIESNNRPLDTALEGTGVCTSFSYFVTALGQEAGLTVYDVRSDNHRWNLVEMNGKFFYIDPNESARLPAAEWLLENFNIASNYMQNPYDNFYSLKRSPDQLAILPEELLRLIDEAQDRKSFIEKYGTNAFKNIIVMGGVLIGLICFSGAVHHQQGKIQNVKRRMG